MNSHGSCSDAPRRSISWGDARALGACVGAWSLLLVACLTGCGAGGATDDGMGGMAGAAGGAAGAGSGGAAAGPAPEACVVSGGLFVLEVRDHAFGSGQDVGQDEFPELIYGPPRGAGERAGSTDHVVALGDGGFVELSFGDWGIVDGEGADFIVFENAFAIGGDPEDPYAELARVSVSRDGETWVPFPCAADEYPYDSCAGWRPVLANADENELDPTNPEEAGGDAFDLAGIGLDWVRFIRIEDVSDALELAFDLDAVSVVHPGCF